ncbi:MAG TPA: PmoA family protein [Methylomirabilota bacterium]|nr:PmoA family protein [Methylomirabilota bacterium]
MISRCLACLILTTGCLCLAADDPLPNAKPVPIAQAIPLPEHEVSFQQNGHELARFHFTPEAFRPFVYPVTGPAGRSLTRMGHPHDPVGHSHHNSVWISHHDVNGASFWDDRGNDRIIVQRVERLDDGDAEAAVLTVAEWRADGVVLLNECRRTAVHPLPNDEWFLLIDLLLEPAREDEVTLGKTPFGMVGVRMAKTIGVHDGGGTIRNSEGSVDEKEVFWKPARWVDYSGPITADAREGITLMDHPSNPNHPTVFHVRDDGWMGASLTFAEARPIKPGEPLRLRYGLYIHAGVPPVGELQARWEMFAGKPLPEMEEN